VEASKVKMKIAIPLFRQRVSPHFGSSSKFLLVETNGTTICQEAVWDVGQGSPMEIARRLVELGIETLICGGIKEYYKDWLAGKGVTVVDNQRGAAREVIQNLFRTKG
jgi:predicted Fe-Mo cluster-binding NifX family protein